VRAVKPRALLEGLLAGTVTNRVCLMEAAWLAARTKGSCYSAQYARIARRRGPNKAAAPIRCSRPRGICSRPVPPTKTPAPTTSSVATILPKRRSESPRVSCSAYPVDFVRGEGDCIRWLDRRSIPMSSAAGR
jgi:hypothetical protein